ncbi:protein of unknown function [Pararobbsia alpina]
MASAWQGFLGDFPIRCAPRPAISHKSLLVNLADGTGAFPRRARRYRTRPHDTPESAQCLAAYGFGRFALLTDPLEIVVPAAHVEPDCLF